MRTFQFILFTVSLSLSPELTESFSVNAPKVTSKLTMTVSSDKNVDRRKLLKDLSTTLTCIGIMNIPKQEALASGGATAGGAYLLSAKQRYNQRVSDGVKAYLALTTSLENGSLEETKAFFTTEEQGGWSDASAAGYLLANAFRRSSTTPPDSLPSVKKWKAFSAELGVLQKALKKKDLKGVKSSYKKSEDLLDAYLEAVSLPPVLEMSR
mmetsp:Transcript_7785/g.9903  ORF Transcript_7785/g.9903 Transcript_7785/m.9903 type:complete len:210 (+) Transcript_7785:127-756(+)